MHMELLALVEYAKMANINVDENELRNVLVSWTEIDFDLKYAKIKDKDEDRKKIAEINKGKLSGNEKIENDLVRTVINELYSSTPGRLYDYAGSLASIVSNYGIDDNRTYRSTDDVSGGENWFIPLSFLLRYVQKSGNEKLSVLSDQTITACKDYRCIYKRGQNLVDGVKKDGPVYVIGYLPALKVLMHILPLCGVTGKLVKNPAKKKGDFENAIEFDSENGDKFDAMFTDGTSKLRESIVLTKAGSDEASQLGKAGASADDGDDTGAGNSEEAKTQEGHEDFARQKESTYGADFGEFDRIVRSRDVAVKNFAGMLNRYVNNGFDGLKPFAEIPYEVKSVGGLVDASMDELEKKCVEDFMIINAVTDYYVAFGKALGIDVKSDEYVCSGIPVRVAKPMLLVTAKVRTAIADAASARPELNADAKRLFDSLNTFFSGIMGPLNKVTDVSKKESGQTADLSVKSELNGKLTAITDRPVPLTSGQQVKVSDVINDIADAIEKQIDDRSEMHLPVEVLSAYTRVIDSEADIRSAIRSGKVPGSMDEAFWDKMKADVNVLSEIYVAHTDAAIRWANVLNTKLGNSTLGKMLANYRTTGDSERDIASIFSKLDNFGHKCYNTYYIPTDKEWAEVDGLVDRLGDLYGKHEPEKAPVADVDKEVSPSPRKSEPVKPVETKEEPKSVEFDPFDDKADEMNQLLSLKWD